MLNNTSAALPMSGVSNASVIYECPVEGRITRWMGVFEDWKNLERSRFRAKPPALVIFYFAQEFHPVYARFRTDAQYARGSFGSEQRQVSTCCPAEPRASSILAVATVRPHQPSGQGYGAYALRVSEGHPEGY